MSTALLIATRAQSMDPITRGDQASRTISPLQHAFHSAVAYTRRRGGRSFRPAAI